MLTQLIQSKLHKPPVPKDYLHRQHLKIRLNKHLHRPLTLVSAPAGYGKSTLISTWLKSCEMQSVWISLDGQDNELIIFLSYFLAAVRNIFPAVCSETSAMLKVLQPPPVSVLAPHLINELDSISESFILVLDDYHLIKNKDIHCLLDELLKHPPKPLHLVLISRCDPCLPLAKIRAKGQMTEIRISDLRFNIEESGAFLETYMGESMDKKAMAVLEKKTEGWVTGLRLAALSMRNHPDKNHFLMNLPGNNRYAVDYILSEVLSQYSSTMQEKLLATSILNRFCAPLCDALCTLSETPCDEKINGQGYIDRLEQDNLFTIPLDDEQEWFRYHHLFQMLLQRVLKQRFNQAGIDALHKQASQWFAENELIEEALHHALKGGATAVAEQLVAQHRHDLINQEQWNRLERWLNLLPHKSIEENPELLIAQAWILYNHMRFTEMVDMVGQVELLVAAFPKESSTDRGLLGEIDVLRSIQFYIGAPCNGPNALAHGQKAAQRLPSQWHSARGHAYIILSMSYQMAGDLTRAHSVVFEALKEKQVFHSSFHTRMLASLCHINWIETDLSNHKQTANRMLELGTELDLPESTAYARHFLGVNSYCRNKLSEAESYLVAVVRDINIVNVYNFAHCAFALALTYQAQGRQTEARETAELVVRHSLATMNKPCLEIAQAFQTELALRQGNVAGSGQWAASYRSESFRTEIHNYSPQLTQVKCLLAQRSSESLIKAKVLLSRLHDFYISIHNRRYVMEVLLLQALLHDFQHHEKTAFEKLSESLAMAEPSVFIRPFLDLGQPMFDLLNRLAKRKRNIKYIGKLLTAFRNERSSAVVVNTPAHRSEITGSAMTKPEPSGDVMDALSRRELDVMALVAQRLSNKEIAEKLFIAEGTVKQHVYKIFQKLNVSHRHEAAEKATVFGLI